MRNDHVRPVRGEIVDQIRFQIPPNAGLRRLRVPKGETIFASKVAISALF